MATQTITTQKIATQNIPRRQATTGNSSSPTDGRTARTAATRQAILNATRHLMVQYGQAPTAKEIATSAGVTTRTLYRHFSDLGLLFNTLIRDSTTRINAVMEEPFAADESANHDWRELLDTVITRRVRVYEQQLPLYASSAWLRSPEGLNSDDQRYAIRRRRQRLQQVLPAAIAEDANLFEALDATLSIDFWLSLRRGQRLNQKRATEVLQHAVHALIKTHTNLEQT